MHAGSANYAFACTQCHPDNNTTHSPRDGTVTVTFAAGFSAGGTYSGAGTKQCSNLYCHGPATVDWDLPTVVVCGSCHGDGTGRPTAPVSGGSHQTTSHVVACNNCHEHNGGAVAGHVDGPASAGVADATVSNAGLSVTSYTVGASLGTDTDGFDYSAGSCLPTCHSTGTWGGTGGCDFCHGYPPNGSNGSTNHLATNRRSNGGAAQRTDAQFIADHSQCATCHGIGGDSVYPALPGGFGTPVDKTADGGDAYVTGTNDNNTFATLNGDAGGGGPNTAYNQGTGGCDNACHGANFTLNTLRTQNVELLELGSGECTGCHDDGTTPNGQVNTMGAPQVTATSSHVATTTAGSFNACEDCHSGHATGTPGANEVEIPTTSTALGGLVPTMNLQYASHGLGSAWAEPRRRAPAGRRRTPRPKPRSAGTVTARTASPSGASTPTPTGRLRTTTWGR